MASEQRGKVIGLADFYDTITVLAVIKAPTRYAGRVFRSAHYVGTSP